MAVSGMAIWMTQDPPRRGTDRVGTSPTIRAVSARLGPVARTSRGEER